MTKKVILVLLLTIAIFCVPFSAIVVRKTTHPEGFTVVIDAGHGGIDGGAIGASGVSESEINLSVALKLKEYYENAGINVVLTRETPLGLYGTLSPGFKKRDLEKRVEITKNADADAFISIHMNKYSSQNRCGAQVFFKDGDTQSRLLANNIQAQLDKVDTDGRVGQVLKGDYYVLNCAKIPSVICECGFMSSPLDESMLITDEYQSKLAYSIFLGSMGYFYENASTPIFAEF